MLKTFGADSKRSARRRAFLEPKTRAAVRHRSGHHTAHESTPRAAHDGAGHSCRDRRPTLMPLVRHAAVPAPERARCCRPRLSLAHVALQQSVATSSAASSSRPSSRQAPAVRPRLSRRRRHRQGAGFLDVRKERLESPRARGVRCSFPLEAVRLPSRPGAQSTPTESTRIRPAAPPAASYFS